MSDKHVKEEPSLHLEPYQRDVTNVKRSGEWLNVESKNQFATAPTWSVLWPGVMIYDVVGTCLSRSTKRCSARWILLVSEFANFDNQWVYVQYTGRKAQQCVEWPEALGNSWTRRWGNEFGSIESISEIVFQLLHRDTVWKVHFNEVCAATLYIWRDMHIAFSPLPFVFSLMTRMNVWLKDPSTGIDFQLCCLMEKWVSITSDTKQHTRTRSAQPHELVSLIAQSDNCSQRGWHQNGRKEAEFSSSVEEIDERRGHWGANIISWSRLLRMPPTGMQTKRENYWSIQQDVWIAYFCWSNWEITRMWQTSNLFVVLRQGKTCSQMHWTVLRIGEQKKRSNYTKLLILVWTITTLKRKNWKIKVNGQMFVLKCLYLARIGRPDILWSVNKLPMDSNMWQTIGTINFLQSFYEWLPPVLSCG